MRHGCGVYFFLHYYVFSYFVITSRGFYIKLGGFRVRSPSPRPVLLTASRSAASCRFCVCCAPRKTLARSPSPFPASTRCTASSTASPRPRRCCVRPRCGGLLRLLLRLRLARLQRTSTAKLQRILKLANFQCTNLRIFVKKSYKLLIIKQL